MTDGISRRGFGAAMGGGLLGLALAPLAAMDAGVARADDLVLRPRWQVHLPQLSVTLHLRAERSIEILANAIRVYAQVGEAEEVALQSPEIAFMRRSRAGFRLRRTVALPAHEEVAYGTFAAPAWPQSVSGDVTIALRTAPLGMVQAPEGARAGLAQLESLRGQVQVTLPG